MQDQKPAKKIVAKQGRGALAVKTDLRAGIKVTLVEEYPHDRHGGRRG